MAAKFVVVLALFASCTANPLHINGVYVREGRGYSLGQAYSSGDGGVAQAQGQAGPGASRAQAYSGQPQPVYLVRDAPVLGPQALAQAQAYDTPAFDGYGSAKAVAQANNGAYYAVPETVIAYQQQVLPEGTYELAPQSAQSAAKTYGFGAATSDANIGSGIASSKANSFGAGLAQSNANVNGGSGTYLRQVRPKSIHWRFGTAYDAPAAAAQAATQGSGYGSANARADVNAPQYSLLKVVEEPTLGSAQSSANAQGLGYGSANANAALNAGYSGAINTQGLGYGAINADITDVEYGVVKSTANTQGSGYGAAKADISGGFAKSTANTAGFGSAASSTNGAGWGLARQGSSGGRTAAQSQSTGSGRASSTANNGQGYKSANSVANSAGFGSARADAHSA